MEEKKPKFSQPIPTGNYRSDPLKGCLSLVLPEKSRNGASLSQGTRKLVTIPRQRGMPGRTKGTFDFFVIFCNFGPICPAAPSTNALLQDLFRGISWTLDSAKSFHAH